MASTASGYDWKDLSCMGGDELRSLEAHELAALLSAALEAGSDSAAERATYYLDTKRFGEVAAVAMAQARDAARDGNFSTAQHLEAIESVIANSCDAGGGSSLTTWQLAQYARRTSRMLTFDSCDLRSLIRDAERVVAPLAD